MKQKFSLISITCLLGAFACSSEPSAPIETPPFVMETRSIEGISSDESDLSPEDAAIVTSIFKAGGKYGSRASMASVSEIIPIKDSEGAIVMYAVNLQDGYVIVSATKKSHPIQAYVEHGQFGEVVTNTGRDVIIQEMIEEKEYAKIHPRDSLLKYEWAMFEKNDFASTEVESRAMSTAMTNARGDFAAGLRDIGYETYLLRNLNEDNSPIPLNILDRFKRRAQSDDFWGDTDDNGINAGIVAVRYASEIKMPSIITTTWNQGYPYNLSDPNVDKQPLGCVTIAVAQIMNYHKWPKTFNWDTFPDVLTENNPTELSDFLYQLKRRIGTNIYGGTNIYDAQKALEYYGYTTRISSNAIYRGLPLYTRGSSKINGSTAHAWVIDGMQQFISQTEYVLFLPSGNFYPNFVYEEAERDESSPTPTTYYHMNWGTGGHIGWFLDYDLSMQDYSNLKMEYTLDRLYMTINK